jgi:hypothetical protein
MREAYSLVWSVLVLLLRSRVSLQTEILILRHQLNIQRGHVPKGVAFSATNRPIIAVSFGAKCRQGADDREAGYRHRLASCRFQIGSRWKCWHRCGQPTVLLKIRRLIRKMSIANRCGERRESMESFSSSASRSARPASPSIWHRTRRSLDKDAPVSRPVQRTGRIKSYPIIGGLLHHYARV